MTGHRLTRHLRSALGAVFAATTVLSVGLAGVAGATTSPDTISIGSTQLVGSGIVATYGGATSGSATVYWMVCTGTVSAGTSSDTTTSTAPTISSCTSFGSNSPISTSSGTVTSSPLLQTSYHEYVLAAIVDATNDTSWTSTVQVLDPAPSASSPGLTLGGSPVLETPVTVSDNFVIANVDSSNLLSAAQFGITDYNPTAATYQWYDCPSGTTVSPATTSPLPSVCNAIGNATSTSYTPTTSDVGLNLLVAETVSNAAGSLTVYSASQTVAGSPPTPTGAATLNFSSSGLAVVSTNFGSWTATPSPLSYTVTWYRCESPVASAATTLPTTCGASNATGSPVLLATQSYSAATASSATYTLQSSDVGGYIFAGISAYNGYFSAVTQYTISTTAVAQVAPVPAGPVSVSGTPVGGLTLSVNPSSWTGLPNLVVQETWYLCPSGVTVSATTQTGTGALSTPSLFGSGSGCSVAGSGLSVTVPTGASYVGDTLTPVVTATTTSGSTVDWEQAWPAGQAIVVPTAPTLTVTVNGGAAADAAFSASTSPSGGTAGLTYTYQYEWYGCTGTVSGADTTTAASGAGAFVTPTTSGGTCSAVASGSAFTVPSTWTLASYGTLVAEVNATASGVGSWYDYATESLFATSATISGMVAATTPTGSQATTAPVSTTLYAQPAITSMPTIAATYSWYLCTTDPSAGTTAPNASTCTQVVGATGSSWATALTSTQLANVNAGTDTYYVVAGASITVSGTASPYYSAGVQLTTQAPALRTYPTVPATASTTTPLVATASTWLGAPTPTLTYSWYVCSQPVTSPSTMLSGVCSSIPVASGVNLLSYQPSGSYVGEYFLVGVEASNGVTIGGAPTNANAYSASTTVGLVSPLSVSSVSITGTATVGSTLLASPTVISTGTYSTAYQWYACSSTVVAAVSVPSGCTAIAGATASSFTLTVNQDNEYVTVLVSVTSNSTTATGVAASTALVTTSIPGAPSGVTAVAGTGQATVTWNAPTSGVTPTSYTVTATPGGATCTATTTRSCVVTGLLYPTGYTFTVTATNSYGTGPASAPSSAVYPTESVPSAPTSVTAAAGVLSATVSWTAASANGAAISLYTVTSSPGGFTCTTTATSCTVSGLTAGVSYTFSVMARNVVGPGPNSYLSAAVTPRPNVPNPPVNITVRRGSAKVTVSWTAGAANGATVSGFVVTLSGTSGSGHCQTAASSCTVTGLVNGARYSVSVVAASAGGSSPVAVGPFVVPAGPPSAPAIVRVARGRGVVMVYLKAPTNLNGARVAYYQFLLNGQRWTVQSIKGRLFVRLLGLSGAHVIRVRAVSVGGASAASAPVRFVAIG
ncbi:MAG: fibronectin type III domain-containing protein [Acidimicrobiales bacterium]